MHLQHLEDKAAENLAPWRGRHLAIAGRLTLVKVVLTAPANFHLTPLFLQVAMLKKFHWLMCAYLWAGSDKVSSGKCKINWDLVYKPKEYGGLGILNPGKFASVLRLRWLWIEWHDPPRSWLGLGMPCNKEDRDIFAGH